MESFDLVIGVMLGFLIGVVFFIFTSFLIATWIRKRFDFRNHIISTENNKPFFYSVLTLLLIILTYLIIVYVRANPSTPMYVSTIFTIGGLFIFVTQAMSFFKKSKLGVSQQVMVYGALYPVNISGILFFVALFTGVTFLLMTSLVSLIFIYSDIDLGLIEGDFYLLVSLMISIILSTLISIGIFNRIIKPYLKTKV